MKILRRIYDANWLKSKKQEQVYMKMATCLAKLGERAMAIQECDKAIALDPDNKAYRWNREQIETGRFGPSSGRVVNISEQ